MDLKIAGQILKQKRTELKKTLTDVSGETGVNVGYLSQVERGDNRSPSVETLAILCRAYDWRLSDLVLKVEEIEDKFPKKKRAKTPKKRQPLQLSAITL